MENKNEIAIFGGGCFWCTEAVFSDLKGVSLVISGYAGGSFVDPKYEDVCTGMTGHAEVIKIEFDPKKIDYQTLLKVFFATHDPTSLNKQGMDTGTQYRSIILYTNDAQKKEAEEFIEKLTKDKVFMNPIVTEIKSLDKFYKAEDYHTKYYEKYTFEPYCQVVINPKLAKFRQEFASLLKNK